MKKRVRWFNFLKKTRLHTLDELKNDQSSERYDIKE